MKTTPKPRATKKSKEDELEPELLLLPEPPVLPGVAPPPLASVLLSVGEGAADVRVTAVGGSELSALGVAMLVATDDSVDKAVSVASLIANRAPSTTAGLMNVILPETNMARWRSGTIYRCRASIRQLSSSSDPSISEVRRDKKSASAPSTWHQHAKRNW